METHTYHFYLDGPPVPQSRPKTNFRTGTIYVPGKAKLKKKILNDLQLCSDYKKLKEYGDLYYFNIYFTAKYYFPIPKSFPKKDYELIKKGIIRPSLKPDCDNLNKTYYDIFNGLLWYDDGQIVESHESKFYSEKPHIEFIIKCDTSTQSAVIRRYARAKGYQEILD